MQDKEKEFLKNNYKLSILLALNCQEQGALINLFVSLLYAASFVFGIYQITNKEYIYGVFMIVFGITLYGLYKKMYKSMRELTQVSFELRKSFTDNFPELGDEDIKKINDKVIPVDNIKINKRLYGRGK